MPSSRRSCHRRNRFGVLARTLDRKDVSRYGSTQLLGSWSKQGDHSMRYRLLGKSGLRGSELCLGTMTFGEDWGWGANKDASRLMYDAFREAGGNFIDTANLYTNG